MRISSTIDKLPDDIKTELDVRLADTANTYEELSAWLKAEGYEISKSAIGRYAIRSTQAAQRVAETLQRTQAIAQAVEAHPDLDYTKAELAFDQLEAELMAAIKQHPELAGELHDVLSRAREKVLDDGED